MRKQVYQLGICMFLLICFAPLAASTESEFELGIKSFRSGDYATAVTYFEAARRQGVESVSLNYNLGSSYFKLGRYDKARQNFEPLLDVAEMKQLIQYNFGLIALRQHNRNLAQQYFSAVAASNIDKKLVVLAENQLYELSMTTFEAINRSSLYLSASLGYDNNINAAPDDSFTSESGVFYSLYLSADRLLIGQRKSGWLLDASLFAVGFDGNDEYDDTQVGMNIRKTTLLHGWESSLQLGLLKSKYGGEDYQSNYKVEASAARPIFGGGKFTVNYRLEDINSDQADFDYLQGSRQKVRLQYTDYQASDHWQLYYELEHNDRGELLTSDYSYDYSPTRHTLFGQYGYDLNQSWQLVGDLMYRISDFPVSSSLNREDKQVRLGVSANYRMSRSLKLLTRLQITNNQSSVDNYEYEKAVFKIGLSQFF